MLLFQLDNLRQKWLVSYYVHKAEMSSVTSCVREEGTIIPFHFMVSLNH